MMTEATTVTPAASLDEGLDAKIRRRATPVAILAALVLALWSGFWAAQGEKPGALGGLLVLTVLAAMGLKLAAETYLFSFLGGDPSPNQALAKRLVGPLSGMTTARFLLGAFGGVILPLGAQLLAVGAKNIPPAISPMPAAVSAGAAAVCLIGGELLAARLYRKAAEEIGADRDVA